MKSEARLRLRTPKRTPPYCQDCRICGHTLFTWLGGYKYGCNKCYTEHTLTSNGFELWT